MGMGAVLGSGLMGAAGGGVGASAGAMSFLGPAGIALGLGLGVAGTVMQAIGGSKDAKAQEEAMQAAALLAREQAAMSAAKSRRRAKRTIGMQRGQVARSGISIEGSQADLLITNTFELELESLAIERFGMAQADQSERAAQSAGRAGRLGMAATVISGAANTAIGASMLFPRGQ